MTPECAEKVKNQARVFYNTVTEAEIRNKRLGLEFKFDLGQVVRILKDQTFQKSYTGNYSNMLYKIVSREKKSGVPVYSLNELLTGEDVKGIFYNEELKPVTINETELPEVDAIHGVRLDNEQEQVLVSYKANPKKRFWIFYDELIPYKH
jgi:hypothetical protein